MKLFYVVLFILITGCAKPKYWTGSPGGGTQPLQNSVVDCPQTFKNSQVCFSVFWEITPTIKNLASLILKTYRINKFDQSIVYVDLGEPPVLIPTMPSMGHGTAKTTTTVLDTGTYRISRISLYMTGEWLLEFFINNQNEKIDEAQILFSL